MTVNIYLWWWCGIAPLVSVGVNTQDIVSQIWYNVVLPECGG